MRPPEHIDTDGSDRDSLYERTRPTVVKGDRRRPDLRSLSGCSAVSDSIAFGRMPGRSSAALVIRRAKDSHDAR